MTNAEKYLKDGVDIKQMATEMVDYFNFPPYEGIGESSIEEFFGKEAKPTLTEDEGVKEMVYSRERKREILATGYYFGLLYYVLNLGTHPTAYVKIPETHWIYKINDYDEIPINCHGGLTYLEDRLYVDETDNPIEGKFIGWDYSHCGDYAPYYEDLSSVGLAEESKKWTTHEILKEVKDVCSQIIELEKKPHLTKEEYIILRNLHEEYRHIRRNEMGNLYIGVDYFGMYDNLFQFIKNRRRVRDKRVIGR